MTEAPPQPDGSRTTDARRPRVALVSSGTGGHLVPALVLAEALKASDWDCDVLLVTEGRGVERALIGDRRLRSIELPLHGRGIRRALRLPAAVANARRLLRSERVDAVVGTGGAVALLTGLAATTLRLPLFALEMNARIGRGNRLLRPFLDALLTALPLRRPARHAVFTGAPVRPGFGATTRSAARARLGLDPARPVVLVMGGSQGAGTLNEHAPRALALSGRPLQVVHLAGPDRADDVRARYQAVSRAGSQHGAAEVGAAEFGAAEVRVEGLSDHVDELMAAADLVVARSGGGTVTELMAAGRASVLVPYPHHRDQQQKHNAMVLVEAGAAELVEERPSSPAVFVGGPDRLTEAVQGLLQDHARRERMESAARQLAPGDSAARIAEIVRTRLEADAPARRRRARLRQPVTSASSAGGEAAA